MVLKSNTKIENLLSGVSFFVLVSVGNFRGVLC